MIARRQRRPLLLLLTLGATAGCHASNEVPEAGALLLRVDLAAGAPTPDELRLYAYDDGGTLWSNARFPSQGTLMPQSASFLGTILLQPGTTVGNLRFDLRGLRGGTVADQAILIVTPAERAAGTFDVSMSAALPSDGDGDGVPDPIDDCPAVPDPSQAGCGLDGGATGGTAGRTATGGSGGAAGTSAGGGSGGQAGATAAGGAGGLAGHTGTGGASGSGGQAGAAGSRGSGGQAGAAGAPGSGGQAGAPASGGAGGHAGAGGGAGTGGLGRGVPCQANGECATGFCTDGVCCDTACTDACKSCTTGTCTKVTSGQDIPECAAPMSCNPKGKCVAN